MDELFQCAEDAMVVVRMEQGKLSEFVDANRSFLGLLGYDSVQELAGVPPTMIYAPERKAEMSRNELRLAKCRTLLTETEWVRKNESTVAVEMSMSLIDRGGEQVVLIIVRNVSGRKWIEEQLRLPYVIGSGFISEQLITSRITLYTPDIELAGYDFEDRSIVHFVASEDTMKLRQKFKECAREGICKEIVFTTLVRNKRNRRKARICPFYKADGTFDAFAFVLQAVHNETSPPVSPSLKLQMLMLNKQMSLIKLCQLTGISKTSLSKLRNGKIQRPHAYTRSLVASALGVEETEIWNDENATL